MLLDSSCECPICKSAVPLRVIRLRSSFDCLACGHALKVHWVHELLVRLTALGLGLLLAYAAGLESVMLFCIGLIIAPLLVFPVWKGISAVINPVLVPASSETTTLNLR